MSKSSVSNTKLEKNKVFLVQDSIHTVRWQNENHRCIYNLCITIFLFFLLNNVTQDYLKNNKIGFGLKTLEQGFGKFEIALTVWILLHIPIFLLYYALRTWYQVYKKLETTPFVKTIWNIFCIILLVGMQISFFYVSSRVCLDYKLQFASTTALLIETFRLMMKSHAFVRTNVPRLLTQKQFTIPMSSYVYFLFAPTLIYRDSYPRTKNIRWRAVFVGLLEMTAIIFLFCFLFENYIQPNFECFATQDISLVEIVGKYVGIMFPSNLIFLSANYFIVQSWLNFTGELMRFGDRSFYGEWWTSRSYKTYYRLYNITVHEWFYEYMYKDAYKYLFKGSEVGSSLMVFYVSAFLHEYVIAFSIRAFFPILSVLFAFFGVIFYFTTHRLPHVIGNIFVWFFFVSGSAIAISFYAMAYYSRKFSF